MQWPTLDERLVAGVFGEPDDRTDAANEFADWLTSLRQQSMPAATMDLCDLAVGRLLHNSHSFPGQFKDRSSWWSGASLYHTGAQAGMIVKNRDTLALATFAWRLWCRALNLAPEPDPDYESDRDDERSWDDEFAGRFIEESFLKAPEHQRLIGADILRIRSQAYATSRSRESLWRGHKDLERALSLLDIPDPAPPPPPGGVGGSANGRIWVPVKPTRPGGPQRQDFVLSDPTIMDGSAELLFGQKISLLRELALVDQQLAFLHLRDSRLEAARRYFRESASYWNEIRVLTLPDALAFFPRVGSELEPLLKALGDESFITLDENRAKGSKKLEKAISIFFSNMDWAGDFREGVETLKSVLLLPDLRKATLELVLRGTGLTPDRLRQVLASLAESGVAEDLNLAEIIVAWSAPDPKWILDCLTVLMESVRERLRDQPPGSPLQFKLEAQMHEVLVCIRDIAQEHRSVFQRSSALSFIEANAYWIQSSFPSCSGLVEELLGLGGGPAGKASG